MPEIACNVRRRTMSYFYYYRRRRRSTKRLVVEKNSEMLVQFRFLPAKRRVYISYEGGAEYDSPQHRVEHIVLPINQDLQQSRTMLNQRLLLAFEQRFDELQALELNDEFIGIVFDCRDLL
jgi:hypothetical protein